MHLTAVSDAIAPAQVHHLDCGAVTLPGIYLYVLLLPLWYHLILGQSIKLK